MNFGAALVPQLAEKSEKQCRFSRADSTDDCNELAPLDPELVHRERGEIGLAALYVLLSVVLSIGGLFGGLALTRSLI